MSPKFSISIALLALVSSSAVLADSRLSTVESRVIVESPLTATGTKVIKITGPDKIEYRVSAPESEVNRLTEVIRTNPDTMVSFNGEVVDENGVKVFRVNKWNKVETTTTTTSTDALGNKTVESKTVTQR